MTSNSGKTISRLLWIIAANIAVILSSVSAYGQKPDYPTFKVAFIGDSGDGPNFGRVLKSIEDEDVDLILHQGDFSYSSGPTRDWLGQIASHVPDIPYLGSVGNHDRWSLYYSSFFAKQIAELGKKGARISGDPKSGNYAIVYQGMKVVFLHDEQRGFQLNGKLTALTDYINDEFKESNVPWKVCSWHENQAAMQVGDKPNQTGWGVYEACRAQGAIIATGHEHSYSRTRTLSNIQAQTKDAACPDDPETPNVDVCVAPGKTFVFVSGLGGTGVRDQDRCLPPTFPYGCNQVWAKIYTSTQSAKFGALFIKFNVDGDPNKAEGYFKNIDGDVIDRFHITRSDKATD